VSRRGSWPQAGGVCRTGSRSGHSWRRPGLVALRDRGTDVRPRRGRARPRRCSRRGRLAAGRAGPAAPPGWVGRTRAPLSRTIIEVSDSTRSGNSIAVLCAIMPPMEEPTTCARSMPSSSRRTDGIDGHVAQRVRRHRPGAVEVPGGEGADELGQVHGAVVILGRQSAVAVVVADHVTASRRQQPTELGVPAEELSAEPHHQQDRQIRRVPERVVLQLDATARRDAHNDLQLLVPHPTCLNIHVECDM
jgi:hypothetical protein